MRIAICEDEIKIAEELKECILKMSQYMSDKNVSVEIFTNGFSLMDYLDEGNVDAIFMDIVLEKENGINLTSNIQEKYNNIKIVFITGYINYVEDVFNVKPFALLMKPISEDRVKNILLKLENALLEEKEEYIVLENKDGAYTIDENTIIYVESDGRYINFITEFSDRIRVIMTMSEVEKKLSHKLIKIHRSYMLNPSKIKKLERNVAIMKNDAHIPISRGNYKEVYEEYIKNIKSL